MRISSCRFAPGAGHREFLQFIFVAALLQPFAWMKTRFHGLLEQLYRCGEIASAYLEEVLTGDSPVGKS